jgi:hypothetical protein
MSMATLTTSPSIFAARPHKSARARAIRHRLAVARDFAVTMAVFGTLAGAAVALRLYVWMPAFAQ